MKFDSDLQAKNDVFFRCVEDANEAIMISDERGSLVYVNPAWSRIYGYSKEEAIGATPRLLHSGTQTKEFYQEMWEKIQNSKHGHWKGELINRAKDGTLVPVILTITPYKRGDRIEGYMGIAVDVTYRRELEAKVAHQDRLASIGMLASGLAHEIGSPLGVVRGRAEMMQSQTENPAHQKNLSIIVHEIDRITKLIRSLLKVSRGYGDISMQKTAPKTVVDEIVTLVHQNLKKLGVEVKVEVSPDTLIWADGNRLEQVILNLVMNSIHAIGKAQTQGRREGHCLVMRETQVDAGGGGRMCLEVKDTGCGIPEINMKKLFQPFFTTKDVGEGTGLGLAIVAQLMREMNGTIEVKSEVNVGTTFSLSFCTGTKNHSR